MSGFHTGFFAGGGGGGGGDTWQPMQAPPPPIPSARHIIHRVVTNWHVLTCSDLGTY